MLMGPACIGMLVMSPVHALFGLHIVRRGLIFIDLAIAQIAALGMALAIHSGKNPQSFEAHSYAVGFALLGALLIALTRRRLPRVPHEAIIGIIYVVASAWAIILLEPTPHGVEELRDILGGTLLFITQREIINTAIIYAVILFVMAILWKPISAMTLNSVNAPKGIKAIILDFVFYGLLGFVVASSVKVAGVFVVFTWLVMPAVASLLWIESMVVAALLAIALGWLGSFIGLVFSQRWDWPTGSSIILWIGILVAVFYIARLIIVPRNTDIDRHPKHRRQ
ncbi:MAG TPA: metal ABC transporter permease [Fimbriimonadales bacterium]|nr:metal ABC transporter permease [Fimbriimonadales bacterium]